MIAATFTLYMLVVVGIGIYAGRFSSFGVSQFFVAGRSLHRTVVALSAVVSGRSAWLLLGFTGLAYQRGASAVWAVVGYIVVEMFLFLGYARRLRRFAEVNDCITLPDFFAARFPGSQRPLRALLVLVIVTFMVTYVAAQFVAGGKAFASSFDLSPTTGLILTAAIVLLYTAVGGFLAVSLTDVLQAVLMLVGLVALPLVVLMQQGGWQAVATELRALDPALLDPAALSLGALIGFLGIGLGSPGNPHIVVRYMSIRHAEHLRSAAVVGTTWNVLMAAGALFIGLVGRAAFPDISALGGDAERLYPVLARGVLPAPLFGLILASVFAAIMSTADSQLLVGASGIVHDLYGRMMRQDRPLSSRRMVWLSRLVVVGLVLLAVALALLSAKIVFWLVLFAWAGLGAALGPTSILALYWRRTTGPGVIAGVMAGTTTVFVWAAIPGWKGVVHEIVPAFAAGLLATVLVSLATEPPAETERAMDQMRGAR